MAILTRHVQPRYWSLNGPQGLAPAYASGGQVQFLFNDVPKTTRGSVGGVARQLANYIPAIALTAFGTIKTNGTGSNRVSWEDLVVALYQNFDMVGAWHGRPLNNQAMRAPTARIWELIAMGYQSGSRHLQWLWSSSANKVFRHTLYIPLSFLLGDDPLYSSQLALLFQNATFTIQLSSGTALIVPSGTTVNTTTGIAATLRASACLIPDPSIRLAPAQEWIEFQQTGASQAGNSITLPSFGDATSLDGVQPGAAISTLLALCTGGPTGTPMNNGPGGSFSADSLTNYSAPFLDQQDTQHLDPFVQGLEQASSLGARPRDQWVTDTAVTTPAVLGEATDISGFPYAPQATGVDATSGNGSKLDSYLLAFPMLVPGSRFQVTKAPFFSGPVNYFRTINAAPDGTTDRTLAHQFKSWSPSKIEDFRQLIISSGLALQVLGTNDPAPDLALNDGATTIDPGKARFMPIKYVKPAPAKAA